MVSSSTNAVLLLAAAALLGSCSSPPGTEREPVTALRAYCDRELRPLDRLVGTGVPITRKDMNRIRVKLAFVRTRLERRARVAPDPRMDRLDPLLVRIEKVADTGAAKEFAKLLDAARVEAARAGVPECHVGTAGRPS